MKPTVSLLIIDASRSMKKFGNAPNDALNEFIAELARSPEASLVSAGIVAFDDDARVLAPIQPVARIQPVTYRTGWRTKLYGTVLECLKCLRALVGGEEANVIVSVFSDGEDNQSPSAKAELIEMSRKAREDGWNLQATGFGIDGAALARKLGFADDADHASSVPADGASVFASLRRASLLTRKTAMGMAVPASRLN